MSTITTVPRPPVAPSKTPPAEERGVMRGVSWNLYDRLTDAIGERSSVRVAFDGKDVEIMVVGPVHEGLGDSWACSLAKSATAWTSIFMGLADDLEAAGRRPRDRSGFVLLLRPGEGGGLPGGSRRGSNDAAAFPIPDLMVEIDISPPKIDRPEIYSKLRPPEVWRFSDDAVSIEQLDANGNYVAADASRFLYVRRGGHSVVARGEVHAAAGLETSHPGLGSRELRPRAGI